MNQSKFELGEVALNVRDLERESQYYQQALGMSVVNQKEGEIELGVANKVLVRLIQSSHSSSGLNYYGLYHFALLLPNRKELGNILRHFMNQRIELVGASDHDYSEAIYLEDPEGNGIEIYCDRPMSEWDIRPDGRIIGGTKPLDFKGVYDLGELNPAGYRLPKGTRMGHIHLSAHDYKQTSQVYQRILNVQEKFAMPTAAWLAYGEYHHHLAVNEWGGKHLNVRSEGVLGLAYYTIYYKDRGAYQAVLQALSEMNMEVMVETEGCSFVDNNGIKTNLILDI